VISKKKPQWRGGCQTESYPKRRLAEWIQSGEKTGKEHLKEDHTCKGGWQRGSHLVRRRRGKEDPSWKGGWKIEFHLEKRLAKRILSR